MRKYQLVTDYVNGKPTITNKYNMYGDVVGKGIFVNGKLNGKGCLYTSNGWIKSPYFKDGRVFGLACIYNDYHEVIFYGIMYNNKIVKEKWQHHQFLHAEYQMVTRSPRIVEEVLRKLSLDLT